MFLSQPRSGENTIVIDQKSNTKIDIVVIISMRISTSVDCVDSKSKTSPCNIYPHPTFKHASIAPPVGVPLRCSHKRNASFSRCARSWRVFASMPKYMLYPGITESSPV